MNYIPADKLIAEIESWIDKAKEKYNESTYSMGRCDALAEFRNHIVFLLQKQPECIYGRTPEEREKCCKFCSAICEARIEQEQPEVDATTLRREAIGKAMEVYPPSINEDADGMPYDEHADLQQGFITGYELGFNARKEGQK